MATDFVAFRAQLDDDASEAFRIAAEDDRPVRRLCPLPGVHDSYRRAGALARRTAARAAVDLGIGTPELRWFRESRVDGDDPRPIVCGGLVLRGYDIVWLNVAAALRASADLEHTVWHECAHLAGYDSEDAADRVADLHVKGASRAAHRHDGDEIKWLPTGAPIDTNFWDLRTGR